MVLRSNYICLSSFTALLRLKRKLYAVCYLLDNSLKHAFIVYEYGCCACHSFDNFIPAIRFTFTCAMNTLPSVVCRGVCDVAVIVP